MREKSLVEVVDEYIQLQNYNCLLYQYNKNNIAGIKTIRKLIEKLASANTQSKKLIIIEPNIRYPQNFSYFHPIINHTKTNGTKVNQAFSIQV